MSRTIAIERKVGALLARWVVVVAKHAVVTLGVAIGLTAASLSYVVHNLGVNANEDDLFSSDLPHLRLERQYHDAFPVLFENIVVVVDAHSPERASAAASALAARMAGEPRIFRGVYLPRNEFFDEHALLYLELDELDTLANRLARAQPYLAGLAEDASLRGLAELLARGVRRLPDADEAHEPGELGRMLERLGQATDAVREGRRYELSWAEVLAGDELEADARRRLIVAQPVLDFSDLLAGEVPLAAVRRLAKELQLDAEHGVRVRLTGDIALSYEELTRVQSEATAAGLASLALVSALLFVALRSLRPILAVLLTLVVGLVWTAAFAAFAIGHLNLISVAFAVLFIGLGVDAGIHLCLRYQEARGQGVEHLDALCEALRGVGSSLVLCAFTTAVGFFAFVPTDFLGVAELGLISGAGVLISLAGTLTVLPALLSLGLRDGTQAARAERPRALRLPQLPLTRPWLVAGGALALALAALALIPRVRFDHNPLRVRDPGAESVQAFQELLARSRTSPWSLNVLEPDLAAAQAMALRLRELDVVETAETISDYIPERQEEKFAILSDLALFLLPPPMWAPSLVSALEQRRALVELRDELDALLAIGAPPDLEAPVRRASESLSALLATEASPGGGALAIAQLQQSLLATLPAQLGRLQRSFEVGQVELASLPPGLVDRLVSPTGVVRVRVYPSEDLFRADALERFVSDVRAVAPHAVGTAIRIHESGRAVVGALEEAFVAAAIVIAISLLVIWRALGDTLLVMGPLALAALFTAAAAVVVGIPFNFADVIVLPLLLGIGVDSAIHLVNRSRQDASHEDLLETSTARAIVYSSLTTIGSFGSLAFASHRGMASLGQLLMLGVVLTMICNLLVLPALIALRARARSRAAKAARPEEPVRPSA